MWALVSLKPNHLFPISYRLLAVFGHWTAVSIVLPREIGQMDKIESAVWASLQDTVRYIVVHAIPTGLVLGALVILATYCYNRFRRF